MKLLLSSVFLFRLFGVPVRAHFTWLLLVAGLLAAGSRGYLDTFSRVRTIGLFIVLVFGSLLVHEFAHVLVARRHGIRASRILILPFGCAVMFERPPHAPYELWLALAGPLASALLGMVSGLALLFGDRPSGFGTAAASPILLVLFEFNILVAGFNLLPCFPMDGGRILRSLLARIVRRFSRLSEADSFLAATFIAVRCFAWPLAAGAIAFSWFTGGGWVYYALLFPLFILVGEGELWLLRDSRRSEQQAPAAEV